MKISMIGVGYVGLVSGACLAEGGCRVICVDRDADKIDRLRNGKVPIYEPGLGEIIERNVKAGRLEFTTDMAYAVKNSRLVFLAVGTPSKEDGSADVSYIYDAASEIAALMDGYRIIVVKSTVPVGTHAKLSEWIRSRTSHPFDYASNPEFLKEGSAVDDFMRPDRVIVGATEPSVIEIMRQIYSPFVRKSNRILFMDPASAELSKYAANVMLATRISFMNELSQLCDVCGADIEQVRACVGSDSRIGNAFLYPGVGFGGSCFPKDLSVLIHMGQTQGCPMDIAKAVQQANLRQRERFAGRVLEYFAGRPSQTTLAVWGLAFKAKTDDIRESPAMACVEMFLSAGAAVRAYDPQAMESAKKVLGQRVTFGENGYDILDGADALVIFTDWQEFRMPDFETIAARLRRPVIFDGRNLYDPAFVAKQGIEYYSIGRPRSA